MFARYVFAWRCRQSLFPLTDRHVWAWMDAPATADGILLLILVRLAILIQINCPPLFIVCAWAHLHLQCLPLLASQSLVIILSSCDLSPDSSSPEDSENDDNDNVFYSRMRPVSASVGGAVRQARGTWIVPVIVPRCFSCYTSLSSLFFRTHSLSEWERERRNKSGTVSKCVLSIEGTYLVVPLLLLLLFLLMVPFNGRLFIDFKWSFSGRKH